MSEKNLDMFLKKIIDFKPKMLFGYPSSLSLIADHAQKKGVDVSRLGVKVAFVTSEKLYDHQREKIEQTFNCKVANGYGGRDAGFIAHQCPEGSMHITAEDIIVEIVNSQGQAVPIGEAGEIVITHLATKDFPFVRYKTGDVGVLSNETCACGRGLPVLKEIQGRSTDFVVAADGTIMHALSLIYELRGVPGVEKFKIVQESIDLTTIHLVKNSAFSAQSEYQICDGISKRLGKDVKIQIKLVDSIPLEKSGKFRYVISHVQL